MSPCDDLEARRHRAETTREPSRVVIEVGEHLSTTPDAEVDMTLEIRVRVPDGVKDDVVRTVSETLEFQTFSFERE